MPGEKDRQYFVRPNEFKRKNTIFGEQHHEGDAELIMSLMSSPPRGINAATFAL